MRRIRTKTLRRGKRLTAIAMSALLAAAPVAALADNVIETQGNTITHDGDISTSANDGIYADNSSTVTQNGDVTVGGDYNYGVSVHHDSTVDVNGDVSTSGDNTDGVFAEYDSSVTVSGDVTTSGEDSYGVESRASTVTVDGDVNTTGDGSWGVVIWEDSNGGNTSSVAVNGNITTTGAEAGGVYVEDGSVVYVGGSVSAEKTEAIAAAVNSSVTVLGNVTSGATGIFIVAGEEDAETGTIVVRGTVTGAENAIGVYSQNDASIYSALPTIVVNTLKSDSTTGLFGYYTMDDNGDLHLSTEVPENIDSALVQAIYYIVNATGLTSDASTIGGNGVVYNAAHEGETLTFKLNVPDGYELDTIDWGDYEDSVVDNGDGTYTIVVERGGNLNFVATYKPIASDDNASDDATNTTTKTASVTTAATAEAIPSTGDASVTPILLVSLAGLSLCGTGVLARRRQRG